MNISTVRRVGLVALLVVFAIAGCSLPAESHPRAIDKAKFPLIFEPGASTTTSIAPSQGKIGWVCFVQQQSKEGPARLSCVARKLKAISPDSLFEALAMGPNEEERQIGGFSSPLPGAAKMLGATPVSAKGVLTVSLSKAMADINSPNNTVAYHQIVKTLTDKRNGLGATAISVKVDGESILIPTDNGPKRIARLSDFDATISTQS